MAAYEPKTTKNLDIYGHDALSWNRVFDVLSGPGHGPEMSIFLGTVSPDGRPHSAGIGMFWHDGYIYFTSGPGTLKSRNLAANPACTVSGRFPGIDVAFEGDAERVSDEETLQTVASEARKGGWPAEVADGALTAPYSAPSAGPPPWHVYRMTYHTVIGVAFEEPHGATRWTF